MLLIKTDLMKHHSTPEKKANLEEFQESVKEAIDLVDRYNIPRYKFFWIFEITPDLRNKVTGAVVSTFTTLAFSMILNFQ
jgi:hypothetical protein